MNLVAPARPAAGARRHWLGFARRPTGPWLRRYESSTLRKPALVV